MTRINMSPRCIYSLFWLGLLSVQWSTSTASYEEPIDARREYIEPALEARDREHWAFQHADLTTRRLPSIVHQEWPNSGIDTYIVRDLEAIGLQPAHPSSPETILRRLKLDLLGLPPEPDEIYAFIEACGEGNASAEIAYVALVEQYLASPRFGERWAQVWLDVARFAETDGFEHDRVRKDAWRYRDWVIGALNEDMPYDQFVRRQLMGDRSDGSEGQIATMFTLAGPDMPDINDQELRRHDRLNEMTSTVGASLLAMQYQCAQCHDHKYDPISQGDFYRLRAVFEPSIPNLKRDEAYTQFESNRMLFNVKSFLYHRGEVRQRGMQVFAAAPRVIGAPTPSSEEWNSDPREAFVGWLFDHDNPLTSRVLVNRIWQSHFGKGLFENPNDVGASAASPTNLHVLDWLANEFQRSDWSMKSIHRCIVLSATYRQTSHRLIEAGKVDANWNKRLSLDPENRLYSRYPRHRLEAESIRDSMLAVSGLLDNRSGGEGVMPPLPDEIVKTLLKGQWTTSERKSDHMRRSIYTFARRNLRYPLLDAFDRPDASASCAKRDRSTTAIQALHMLNSEFSNDCSRKLCSELLAGALSHKVKEEGTVIEVRIQRLFVRVLGRVPSRHEIDWLTSFIRESSGDESIRWMAVCSAILNTSEFVYID